MGEKVRLFIITVVWVKEYEREKSNMAAFVSISSFFFFKLLLGGQGLTLFTPFPPFSFILLDFICLLSSLHSSPLLSSLYLSLSLSFPVSLSLSLFFPFCLRSGGDLEFLDGKPEGGLSSFLVCLNSPISQQQHEEISNKI